MEATSQRDTGPEVELRRALHRLGWRFYVDRAPFEGMRSRADILFPRHALAIFVDGCFWHSCPIHGTWPKNNAAWWRAKIEGNQARDRRVTTQLIEAGWRVLRLWEHEPLALAQEKVLELLQGRRGSCLEVRSRAHAF